MQAATAEGGIGTWQAAAAASAARHTRIRQRQAHGVGAVLADGLAQGLEVACRAAKGRKFRSNVFTRLLCCPNKAQCSLCCSIAANPAIPHNALASPVDLLIFSAFSSRWPLQRMARGHMSGRPDHIAVWL